MENSLYHLHIPRTSGTFLFEHICSEIIIALKSGILNEKNNPNWKKTIDACMPMEDIQIYEKYLRPTQVFEETKDPFFYIAGHYGIGPMLSGHVKSSHTFSIIRHPYEHVVSSAAYTCEKSSIEFTNEFFNQYIRGEFAVENNSVFCSGVKNVQAKMLSCKLEKINKFVDKNGENTVCFVNPDIVEKMSISEIVSEKTILSFDNRHQIEDWITEALNKIFKIKIKHFPKNIRNKSNKNNITITQEQKKIIKKSNELDFELFYYSRNSRPQFNF